MTYSEKELESIKQMASIYTKPSEIAILLGVREEVFKDDIATDGHPARLAYIRGKLSMNMEIRRQTAMLAKVGSPVALEMAERARLEMEDDE